jgi:hypothetical protein
MPPLRRKVSMTRKRKMRRWHDQRITNISFYKINLFKIPSNYF